MWYCLACYMCTVRRPPDIKPTELAHALESLATQHGFKVKGTTTPAMYRSFGSPTKDNGCVPEFGMMFRYYLTTNLPAALKMLPLELKLLVHKRMSLMPGNIEGKEDLAGMIRKCKEARGNW